jgi:asparagine synthase (glutamine-hydrolysing)
MNGRLPETTRQRPKKGLATPHSTWWCSDQLPAWAEEALHPAALQETGYFNPATVAHLRQKHQNGRANHSRLLTGILTSQLWHDQFLSD